MGRPNGGFLLLEILVAVALVALAGLAALDGMEAAARARRRAMSDREVAGCAEEKLGVTMLGRSPGLSACAENGESVLTTTLSGGSVEDVRWSIGAPGRAAETFETIRYAG